MLHRRQFLGLSGALVGALGLPRRALASPGGDRKFIFVFAQGGWDPTRVMADGFDHAAVDMEAGAERATAGGLSYVDHPDRPSVRAFFEANHARSVIFDGVMVRSIAHEICTMIAMTGTTSGVSPDWPAVIASRAPSATLPHVVLGGPSFPGDLGGSVARTGSNGQLEALLNGEALAWSDTPVTPLRTPSQKMVDAWLARRASARADAARSSVDAALARDFATSVEKMRDLKDLEYVMDFTSGGELESQVGVACDVLSMGVARCVTLSTGTAGAWDTHANNDDDQSPLWEATFAGLVQLQAQLAASPGTSAATLAEETVVVVLSEMGRTPALNAFNGKDHWPYTSVLLFGAGVAGDRVIGGFDDNWYGRLVDPVSGDVAESGQVLSAESVGATLLALADVDPADYVSGVDPIEGVLT